MATYTRYLWCQNLLKKLGNINPDYRVVYWLCGWSSFEIQCGVGCDMPLNNLLATELCYNKSTNWNGACKGKVCDVHNSRCSGVQAYASMDDGIQANADVLLYGAAYQGLTAALKANDRCALGATCKAASSVVSALETWKNSKGGYADDTAQFEGIGAHNQDQHFSDGAPGNTPDFCAQIDGTDQKALALCHECSNLKPPYCNGDKSCIDNVVNVCKSCVYGMAQGEWKDSRFCTLNDETKCEQTCLTASLPAPNNPFGTIGQLLSNPVQLLEVIAGLLLLGVGFIFAYGILTGKSAGFQLASVAKVAALA